MNDNVDGGNEGVLQLMHSNEIQVSRIIRNCRHVSYIFYYFFTFRDFNNGQFVNSGAHPHINDVSRYKVFYSKTRCDIPDQTLLYRGIKFEIKVQNFKEQHFYFFFAGNKF